ncbi:hypothetical protein CFIO01_03095, partial [Colletotrichum fioriniae PJ7]
GSSTPVFTPESSRSPSIIRSEASLFPELILPSQVSPDEPIPSVETEAWAGVLSGAPILSHRAADNVHGDQNSARDSPETGSITDRLDRLVIERFDRTPSEMGLAEIRAALPSLFDDVGRQGPQSNNPAPDFRQSSLSPRPPRRSRGRSEVALVYHDVQDEELPESRFYDPAVQIAIEDAKALMAQLAGVLENSPLHANSDSTIKRLHDQAVDLAKFQGPSRRTVGFVGDSGVGKSSVLNSLLDQKDLARTVGYGRPYVEPQLLVNDGDDFAIEVELFSQDDLMEQVKELLQSYRRFHLNTGDLRRNDEAAAAVDIEEQANVARDTFRSMFRGQLASEDFLINEEEPTVLRTFRSWLQRMDLSLEGRHEKASRDSCSAFLMHVTSESVDTRTPAVWPFVRKIKVFLSSHILSKGLILVDLPGLRDSNSARRLITERYLVECDEIFAICNIGRATTDVGVQSVFELAQQAGLSNVGIVCTKSDVRTFENLQFPNLSITLKRQLRRTYKDKIPDGNLALFCVSNIIYWDERHQPRDVALPSLQLSGILALRKHCLGIVADSQLSIAKRYIDNDIPAILGEAALWVESGAGSASAEQKRQIRDTLNSIEFRLKRVRESARQFLFTFDFWAHGTYSAFCRNFGNHHTPAAGWHDWNQEMICIMAGDVTPQWDSVCTSCRARLEQSGRLIQSQIDWALELLENELEIFPGVTDLLQETLICHKNIMESQIEDLTDKVGADLNSLRIDALTGIRTSILGQAMEAPYRRCNAEYGGGSDRRRKSIIRNAVGRVDLFENHMTEFKSRMRLLADNVQTELQAIVRAGLAAITSVLDLIRTDNIATESEENPELRRRLEQEIVTIRERMRRIIDIME